MWGMAANSQEAWVLSELFCTVIRSQTIQEIHQEITPPVTWIPAVGEREFDMLHAAAEP